MFLKKLKTGVQNCHQITRRDSSNIFSQVINIGRMTGFLQIPQTQGPQHLCRWDKVLQILCVIVIKSNQIAASANKCLSKLKKEYPAAKREGIACVVVPSDPMRASNL